MKTDIEDMTMTYYTLDSFLADLTLETLREGVDPNADSYDLEAIKADLRKRWPLAYGEGLLSGDEAQGIAMATFYFAEWRADAADRRWRGEAPGTTDV